MGPSWRDFDYQAGLAQRGAYLEYDMISMDYYYADQNAQCPSDEENAFAIRNLIQSGYIERILISQDVFLKMMLTSYGGFGYGYILRHFVPRLRRLGVTEDEIKIADNKVMVKDAIAKLERIPPALADHEQVKLAKAELMKLLADPGRDRSAAARKVMDAMDKADQGLKEKAKDIFGMDQ